MDSSSPVVAEGLEQAQASHRGAAVGEGLVDAGVGGWGELINHDDSRGVGVGGEGSESFDYSHLLLGDETGTGNVPAGAINGYLPVTGMGGGAGGGGGGEGGGSFLIDPIWNAYEETGELCFVVPEAACSW